MHVLVNSMNGANLTNTAVLHVLGKLPRFEQFAEPVAGDGENAITIAKLLSAGRVVAAFAVYVFDSRTGLLRAGKRLYGFIPALASVLNVDQQSSPRFTAWHKGDLTDLPFSWSYASPITAPHSLVRRLKPLRGLPLGRNARLAGRMRLRQRCYESRFIRMASNVA